MWHYIQAPTATKHVKCCRLFKVSCYLNHPDVVVQPSIADTTKILARMVRLLMMSHADSLTYASDVKDFYFFRQHPGSSEPFYFSGSFVFCSHGAHHGGSLDVSLSHLSDQVICDRPTSYQGINSVCHVSHLPLRDVFLQLSLKLEVGHKVSTLASAVIFSDLFRKCCGTNLDYTFVKHCGFRVSPIDVHR